MKSGADRPVTVLVTGASRGIGKGIAEIFASNGCNIAAGYFNSKDLAGETCNQLSSEYGIDAIPLQGDVSVFKDCKKIVQETKEKFGGIDILVNNAGQYKRFPDEEERTRLAMLKLNSVDYLSQLTHRREILARSIINISSSFCAPNGADAMTPPLTAAYQAGVETLTLYYARKFKETTAVNCIRPGYCDTGLLHKNYDSVEIAAITSDVPSRGPAASGRLIGIKELGELVFFVATNRLLTGQIITADMGATLPSFNDGPYDNELW